MEHVYSPLQGWDTARLRTQITTAGSSILACPGNSEIDNLPVHNSVRGNSTLHNTACSSILACPGNSEIDNFPVNNSVRENSTLKTQMHGDLSWPI